MFAGRYNKGHGVLAPQVPWDQEMISPEPVIQMHLAHLRDSVEGLINSST